MNTQNISSKFIAFTLVLAGVTVSAAPIVNTSAFESIGMREERFKARAANASQANLDALVRTANLHAATRVLRAGPSSDTIGTTDISARDRLVADMNQKVDFSAKAVAVLKTDSQSLSGDSKNEFKAATKDVAVREQELKASLKAAQKASADEWPESRARVAANYDAYTKSVARAETAAAGREPGQPETANAKAVVVAKASTDR